MWIGWHLITCWELFVRYIHDFIHMQWQIPKLLTEHCFSCLRCFIHTIHLSSAPTLTTPEDGSWLCEALVLAPYEEMTQTKAQLSWSIFCATQSTAVFKFIQRAVLHGTAVKTTSNFPVGVGGQLQKWSVPGHMVNSRRGDIEVHVSVSTFLHL